MYAQTEVVSAVSEAVDMAEGDLQRRAPGVQLTLEYRALKLGESLGKQIIDLVRNSSAAVFEVSEENPNVYFEMGLAYTSRVTRPLLLFNQRAAKKVLIASDVREFLRLHYRQGNLRSKVGPIAEHIRKEIEQKIAQEARADIWSDLRRVWSGSVSTTRISVVCPELPPAYRPRFARRSSPEFVDLARYGDLDTLVEVLSLLPKLFPTAEVRHQTAAKITSSDRAENLVVVGGPDFNRLTAELMRPRDFPFKYRLRTRKWALVESSTGREFPLEVTATGRVTEDYGLFARFPNPFNRRNAVVMIGGLQTFGVLAAAQAFGPSTTGRANARKVTRRCVGTPRFAVIVPVTVSGSQLSAGQIDTTAFHPYPW